MSIGGIGTKLALAKSQKPTQKCKRCGLLYPKDAAFCPHCEKLDDVELKDLLGAIESQRESNRGLGLLFAGVAGLLVIGLVILAL